MSIHTICCTKIANGMPAIYNKHIHSVDQPARRVHWHFLRRHYKLPHVCIFRNEWTRNFNHLAKNICCLQPTHQFEECAQSAEALIVALCASYPKICIYYTIYTIYILVYHICTIHGQIMREQNTKYSHMAHRARAIPSHRVLQDRWNIMCICNLLWETLCNAAQTVSHSHHTAYSNILWYTRKNTAEWRRDGTPKNNQLSSNW